MHISDLEKHMDAFREAHGCLQEAHGCFQEACDHLLVKLARTFRRRCPVAGRSKSCAERVTRCYETAIGIGDRPCERVSSGRPPLDGLRTTSCMNVAHCFLLAAIDVAVAQCTDVS